jgi:hypothetical protein
MTGGQSAPATSAAGEADGHDAPAATGAVPVALKDRPAVALVTFLIALLGAVTGSLSFFAARDIDVTATAGYGAAQRSWSLQVSLVNNSQRGVSLVSAEYYVGNTPVAHVERWLGSVPEADDPRPENEIYSGAQPLPVAVTPGSSIVGTAVFSEPDGSPDDDRVLDLYNQVFAGGVPHLEEPAPLTLRMVFKPDYALTVTVAPPPQWASPREFADEGFAPGWHGLYIFREDAMVKKIQLKGNNDRPGLGRVELYRPAGEGSFYAIERPVPTAGYVLFPLPKLEPGTYVYSYTVDGEMRAAVTLVQPCPKEYFEESDLDYPPGSSGVDACFPPEEQ